MLIEGAQFSQTNLNPNFEPLPFTDLLLTSIDQLEDFLHEWITKRDQLATNADIGSHPRELNSNKEQKEK